MGNWVTFVKGMLLRAKGWVFWNISFITTLYVHDTSDLPFMLYGKAVSFLLVLCPPCVPAAGTVRQVGDFFLPGFIYLSSITMVLVSKIGKEGLVQICDMFTGKSIAV